MIGKTLDEARKITNKQIALENIFVFQIYDWVTPIY